MSALPHPLPLRTDALALGLRRVVVNTSVGELTVRTGRARGRPATVLLHGAAGAWTTWTPVLAASDLAGAAMTDVVAIDLPGWGESGDGGGVRCVEDVSDAVIEVTRALGYSSWRIVGHSLGGLVALDIAARHREATLGVTLVSPTGPAVIDAVRRPVRGGAALPWFGGMLLAMRALAVLGPAGLAVVRSLGRAGVLPALSSPLFTARVHPSVIAALAREVRPRSFARAAAMAADHEVRTWTGIRCPVRSVRGARDVFAGESDAAAFAALIPDFSEMRLADAGHFAHIERPDAVLTAIAATAPSLPRSAPARRVPTSGPFTDAARRLVRTRSGVSRP